MAKKNLQLSLKSLMLFRQNAFYLNGEKLNVPIDLPTDLIACMRELADKRYLATLSLPPSFHAVLAETLHAYYLAGFITFK